MDDDKWISEYLRPKRILKQFEKFNANDDQSMSALTEMLTRLSIEWFPRYFEKMYGIKIEIDALKAKEFREYLEGFMNKILGAAKKVAELPEGSVCEAINIIGEPVLELLTQHPEYRDKKYESIFDFYEDFYKRILFSDFHDSYLTKTSIGSCRKAIHTLIDKVFLDGNAMKLLSNIFDSHEFSTDMFFVQKYLFGLIADLSYLDGEFKRYREPTVYKLADLYYRLSEIYSKFVVVIRIMVEFVEGNTKVNLQNEYNKHSLNNHVEKIKRYSDYSVLGDINVVMRNALSHRTYQYDREQKSILFRDKQSSVMLKPKELLGITRKLSGLVLAISEMMNYVQYRRLSLLSDYCRTRKAKTNMSDQ